MNSLELNKDYENHSEEASLNTEATANVQTNESVIQEENQEQPKDAISEKVEEKTQEPTIEKAEKQPENSAAVEESPTQTENVEETTTEVFQSQATDDTTVEIHVQEESAEQKNLTEEKTQETKSEEKSEQVELPKSQNSPEKTKDYNSYNRAQLIEALKVTLTQDVEQVKDEVEQIKQLFYKKLKLENEEQKKQFVEEGGEEYDFKPQKDELEDELRSLLADFKAQKAVYMARVEQEKENNLIQKQHVLEQMKLLTETTDDVSSHIGQFKELQQKWKNTGGVPATMSSGLWKQYNLLQEQFWDLVKINNELREYDFKKNLILKTELCEAAERLLEEKDVVVAIRQLQKLHDDWRETGPVARDTREVIWARFKDATSQINKKHQAYFDELRKSEEENLELKNAICEKIENYDFSNLTTYANWDKAIQEIIAYQKEFSKIGYVPRKENQRVFGRYRKACDAFFSAKTSFYKESKQELADNLQKKRALIEQAESLKDSKDWKETSNKFIKLQKEWKEIGVVQKKYSDEIWKRFIAACDHFFEERNKNFSTQRSEEHENLKKKQELIEKINNLEVTKKSTESYENLKELIEAFRLIGHVPFKEKDKIYKAYREAIDKQFTALNIDISNRKLDSFKNNLEDMSNKGDSKLYRERERLIRIRENLKTEIGTCENNIGFFTSNSKKSNPLLKELERKIEALKDEYELIKQKIDLLEDKLSD